jgi:hypothetical protein
MATGAWKQSLPPAPSPPSPQMDDGKGWVTVGNKKRRIKST